MLLHSFFKSGICKDEIEVLF